MKKWAKREYIALAALLLLFSVATVGAQDASQQISGFVKDSSGAALAGATVTITQTAKRLERSTTTSDTGYFVIVNIPIGAYDVSVEMSGFKKFVQTGLEVTVGSKPAVDATLEVGGVEDVVTVTSDVANVESSNGEVGRLITGEQIGNLQLNGRNFTQLLALVPGVSTTYRSPTDLLGGFGSNQGTLNVNGGRRGAQSWNIDGADNKDNGGSGNNFVNINPDALAEFKVLTSNYSAEFGQSSGAVVNMVLKSGTQDFHGTAYEYLRNDALDARAYNTLVKQKLRYNNFGGSVGGPVYIPGKFNADKTKLFFFFSTDIKRLRQGAPTLWNVPTLAQRNGDFSALPPAQWPVDPATGRAFPNGVIPASRISPNAKRLIDNYPAPNFGGSGGNYQFTPTNPIDVDQYIVKVDYVKSQKHQIAGHYARDQFYALQNTTNLMTFDRSIPGENSSLKWTWIVNPTVVNTAQFVASGNSILQTNFTPNPLLADDTTRAGNGVTYPRIFGASDFIPSINIGGFTGLGVRPIEFSNFNTVFQLKDDLSKIVRTHSLKFGALLMRSRKNQDNQPAINGTFNFDSLPLALLGNFNNYNEAGRGREGWFRFSQFEFYGLDNWKINRRLSAEFGVRYYVFGPQYSALNNATIFVPRLYNPAAAPQINASTGQLIAGTGDPVNGLALAGDSIPEAGQERIPNVNSPTIRSLFKGLPEKFLDNSHVFGPRVSFALDLLGDETTVVRGGYGMTYERIQGNYIFGAINNPPFVQDATVFGGNVENPTGGAQRVLPQNVNTSFAENLEIPTVQNFSLGIQRKISGDTIAEVSYVGSNGYHQTRSLRLNQLRVGTLQANPGVNANALRPYRGYADIIQLDAGSTFNYHSMQALFRKTFRGGGLVNLAYTWSKSIADVSDFNTIPVDSYNPTIDRGLATYDRPHIFVASYVYPLPFWLNGDRWYKKALGGWTFSGVTTAQSGRPLNITVNGDPAGIGTPGNQRPNLIGNPHLPADERTASRWFNTAAFAVPAAGTLGNLGFDALRGPGSQNWDMSFHKSFPIKERLQTEFRFEVFNVFNHLNYFNVGTTVGAANFGQVTQAADPRILQLAIRFEF